MTSGAKGRCVDSGIIVAAFAPWHERHSDANALVAVHPHVVAHSLVETYSVMTRLPAPFRAPADVVATFLARRFPDDPLVLPAGDLVGLLERLATVGVHGGAVYDAVIGATAGSADCVLVTLDRRAARTYRLVGCSFELL